MSGAFGLGLASALLVALDQAPVVLGSVVFEGHEVPSRIGIGGAHAVTIHRLPGGGRIVDAMGVDDSAISWGGFFTGPSAAARARVVDAMRQSGELVGLSFGDYAFNVVVVHFEYDLQDRGALIAYRIRTETIPETVAQTDNTEADVVTSFSADIASATTALSGFALTASQAALSSVRSAIASPRPATSPANLAAVGLALQGAGGALRSSIIGSANAFPTAGESQTLGVTTSAGLSAATAAAGSLAAATQAAGYVNRSRNSLNQLAAQPNGAPLITA